MGFARTFFRNALGVVFIAAVTLGGSVAAAQGGRSGSRPPDASGEFVLVQPLRRAQNSPPAPLPDLPPEADRITPITFDVVIERRPRSGPASTVRQTVSRTKDRLHLQASGREWLFERNPLDPRRVSALLVDHASRHVVIHEESDLRNTLGISGWADLLLMGLEPKASSVQWTSEPLLPARFAIRDAAGTTSVAVRRIRHDVDATVLAHPNTRWPAYPVVTLADWLERH